MLGLGTILAGGSILGSILGARSASKAADVQAEANEKAIEEQRRQFDLVREDTAPLRELGVQAIQGDGGLSDKLDRLDSYTGRLAERTGRLGDKYQGAITDASRRFRDDVTGLTRDMDAETTGYTDRYAGRLRDAVRSYRDESSDRAMRQNFRTDPGYEFRLKEGQDAIERSAAARGNVLGAATMKGLDRYSQGVASDEYDRYYNRSMNRLGSLLDARTNAAGSIYGARMADAEGDFSRGYGLAGDLYQSKAAQAGARYDTGMGTLNANYGREMDNWNKLMGAVGLGQTGTQLSAQTGAQTTAGITQALQNIGQAQAQGAIGVGNAWNAGIDNMMGILGAAQQGMFSQPINWGQSFGWGGQPAAAAPTPTATQPVNPYGIY